MPHFSCDFSTDRGHRRLSARINEERVLFPSSRILVVLDHYWLPKYYYSERYGTLWLEIGMCTLLHGGADEILLPFDDGKRHAGVSDMREMLAGRCHPKVNVELVGTADNPLWVASSEVEICPLLADTHGGDNEENTWSWLHPVHPFVRGTLKKT